MRVIVVVGILCAVQVDSQFWDHPQNLFQSWFRQGKATSHRETTLPPPTTVATKSESTVKTSLPTTLSETTGTKKLAKAKTTFIPIQTSTKTTAVQTTLPVTTQSTTTARKTTLNDNSEVASTLTEGSTVYETTTHDVTGTTEEPRDNSRTHEFYLSKREKPQIKIAANLSQNLLPLPAGAGAALVKPTKYHYYPHNQHIYLLPECAIQQVCNAVYIRLNWTQPLCACPSRYRDPCSASLNSDDQHTTELMIDRKSKVLGDKHGTKNDKPLEMSPEKTRYPECEKIARNAGDRANLYLLRALTLVKTCEPTTEMRVCRSPRDWSLLALQNIRTGKSHYLVICRCPDTSILEGPMSHDQPTYASVPGIRVYGMMCVDNNKRRGRPLRTLRSLEIPKFPWKKAVELFKTTSWD